LANSPTENEVVAVLAFLSDGDLIGVPSGNMVTLYRVRNDAIKGETTFENEGLATMTGSHHVVRRWRR
jgi:hypothetical protein